MDGFSDNDIRKVVEADKAHVWHHLTQHKAFETADPRIIVEGKGMRVWDATGKEYIDAVSGAVWTVNVGYGRESIAKAIADQLVKLNYFAGAAGSIPGAIFAEKLIAKMPGMTRVYYANSGSEANEKAFKMVRQIAHKRYGGKKHKILYRDRDYHGGTIGTMAAGGQNERNMQYGPFPEGFVRVPHCLEYRAQWDLVGRGIRGARGRGHRGGDPARRPRHRRRALPRAGHRRRRRDRAARRLLAAGAGDLRPLRHPVAYRRGGLRHGPHRHLVRLRALRASRPDFVTLAKGVASRLRRHRRAW